MTTSPAMQRIECIAWEDAPLPDEAFRKAWASTLSEITNWADWRFAPRHLNYTEAHTWSYRVGSRETIYLSSGDTLVRRPGMPPVCEPDEVVVQMLKP